MVGWVKTTIELPDELLAQAREAARRQGVTLKQLISDGLRTELERRAEPGRTDFVFPTGGAPDDGWPGEVSVTELIYESYGDRL